MNFEKDIKAKLEQSDFAKNNGRILRTINIMHGKFVNIDSVCDALEQYMNIGEFDESLIYLHKSCYVEIRIKSNAKIIDDFSKYSYKEIEVSLTQKGIKLARGFVADEAVEV